MELAGRLGNLLRDRRGSAADGASGIKDRRCNGFLDRSELRDPWEMGGGAANRLIVAVVAIACSVLLSANAQERATEPALFKIVDAGGARSSGSPVVEPLDLETPVDGAQEAVPVAVDGSLLRFARDAALSGSSISVSLEFPRANFVAVLGRTRKSRHGYLLYGSIRGHPGSTVTMAVSGRAVAAVFNVDGRTWTLAPRDGGHVVAEAGTGFECEAGRQASVAPHPASGSVGGAASTGNADDGSEVDLLVLYTSAVRRRSGGLDGIRSLVDVDVETANEAFRLGEAELRFNLVGVAEVAYNESDYPNVPSYSKTGDLDRLRAANDGVLDEVHTLRDRYAADIVHLVVDRGAGGGTADVSLLEDPPESHAFSVSGFDTRQRQPHLIPHELGHVMGLRHDRHVDPVNEPFPYSHGYVNRRAFERGAPSESRWSTIMAYQDQCHQFNFSCPHVLRYSNPDQLHPVSLDPLGVAGDEPTGATDGPADAVRSLNETRATVARYRDSSERCEYRLSSEEVVVGSDGASLTVAVSTDEGCAWEAWTPDGFTVARSDTEGSGPGEIQYSVEANSGGARIGHVIVGAETVVVKQRGAVSVASVCDRTPQVRDAIVHAAGEEDCAAVGEFDLLSLSGLQIGGRGISVLDAKDFEGLSNLDRLSVFDTSIRELPIGIFEHLVHLTDLVLARNDIGALRPDLFAHNSRLTRLSLFGNDIADLPQGLFDATPNLFELSVGYNRLSRLPRGIFAGLEDLHGLLLGNNSLVGRSLHADVFLGLDGMKRLSLRGNPLGELGDDAFVHLKGLVQVHLEGADLAAMPKFHSDMSWVELGDNRIGSLEGVPLSGRRISRLELSGNGLHWIPDGYFVGYSSYHCTTRNFNLHLEDNPGAPFVFRLDLVRLDAPRAAPGPAQVALRLRTGAPLPLTARVEVEGDVLLTEPTASIQSGAVEGAPIEARGDSAAILSLAHHASLELPGTYRGIEVELGEPLRLFALDDRTLETGVPLRLDLAALLAAPGTTLTSVDIATSDGSVATAAVVDGVLVVDPLSPGATVISVDAVDGNGVAFTREFTVSTVRAGRPARTIPYFPSAADADRQGFARVINHSDAPSTVRIEAVDDEGATYGPVTLEIGGGETVHFNSDDLERGNAEKGLAGWTGRGQGDWRLEFATDSDIEVLSYIRTLDGFLTAMHDIVPIVDGRHRVATFNPGRNANQVSMLRLVNPTEEAVRVTVEGIDDRGHPSAAVRVSIPAGASRTYTASMLESGAATGLEGALGVGDGKWRLLVDAPDAVVAMSLLSSATGHLTNLSSAPQQQQDRWTVPLFPQASDTRGRQGFVRLINRSDRAGEVRVDARDGTDHEFEAVVVAVGANETVHFNSDDLERGNSRKGITGATGDGEGDWRLELSSDVDVEVLSYLRTRDGFLTAMHDVAPHWQVRHRIATFNPGSNVSQVSLLRLVNWGSVATEVRIRGTDDAGRMSGEVRVVVPGGVARTLSARDLESGTEGVRGAFGDGSGKWRIAVESGRPIMVMSLLESATGHLTNLSAAQFRDPGPPQR